MSCLTLSQTRQQAEGLSSLTSGILQRKCACGQHTVAGGECEECHKKQGGMLQRATVSPPSVNSVPPIVHGVLSSPGQPLDAGTRAFMEPRFGYDFSQVRVHINAKAAESAQAVNALAYTVGQDVVFGARKYAPETMEGKRLIAHELTHAVQQGTRIQRTVDRLEISDPGDATEQEAEASANAILQGWSFIPMVGEAMLIARQGPPQTQTTAASTSPADPIREARIGASIRCLLAHERVVGIGPPAPPGREDPALEWQRRARSLARKIFGIADPDMDMIDRIISKMLDRLSSNLPVVHAPANDPNCGTRAAYVIDYSPPIHLCTTFFSDTPEKRIQTMVHEAAHLAGIGESRGESYCGVFDCEGSCGGTNVADSWAHFVHCLSGQPAEQPDVIQIQRK